MLDLYLLIGLGLDLHVYASAMQAVVNQVRFPANRIITSSGSAAPAAQVAGPAHGPTPPRATLVIMAPQVPAGWLQGYEPYVLVSRQHVPWYDERFMGYGWDKIVFIMDLAG